MKKKDFRGNYKVKFDRRLKTYPITTEISDFYLPSLFEQPIRISRWFWNWKFPFLHHLVKEGTFMSFQKELNEHLNKALDIKAKEIFKSSSTVSY